MSLLSGKRSKLLFVLTLLAVFPFISANASVYYVSPIGDDGESGTIDNPWKLLNASVNKLAPGDTLFVREGTYVEMISVNVSGIANAPITIAAYAGEMAVIDGQNTLPVCDWCALLNLNGNFVHMIGFEVKNTSNHNAKGVDIAGHHSIVSHFNVHHTYQNGILVKGDSSIVEDSRVWQACRNNLDGQGTQGWASGLSAARDNSDGITDNAILRRNVVYNNWGEGFSTFEAQGTVMEDNIIFDNWQTNVYISDAPNVLFQRNLVYNTQNSVVGRQGGGIWLADEVAAKPRSDHNTLINNLILNGNVSLFSWTVVPASGFTNALFASNTLVNAPLSTGMLNSNNHILNNIFTTTGNVPAASGITWSHNLWSSARPVTATGVGDVSGDPLLEKTGTVAPHQLTPDYFRISSSASPAVNHAAVLSGVTLDYFGTGRGASPDIGAHEFVEGTEVDLCWPSVTAPVSPIQINPASTGLCIQVNLTEPYRVSLFNIAGRALTGKSGMGPARFTLPAQSTVGIYFVRATTPSTGSVFRKITVIP